jgi:DNA mismatch repair protein MutS
LYVPAKKFQFKQYKNLFCRIGNLDDPFLGHSSFTVEMLELKSIIARSTANTLCIFDELCSSTEFISALALSSATIIDLAEKGTSFVFATHFHDLYNLPTIKALKGISVFNLDVEYSEEKGLIFHRKLKAGGCDTLYGIVVSKAILNEPGFQMKVNSARDSILGRKKNLLDFKKSKYNSAKTVDSCAICGIAEGLCVHHINPQDLSDINGNINGEFNKNNQNNLVCLCEECHQAHHGGKIEIRGWIVTLQGRFLDFSVCNTEVEKKIKEKMGN